MPETVKLEKISDEQIDGLSSAQINTLQSNGEVTLDDPPAPAAVVPAPAKPGEPPAPTADSTKPPAATAPAPGAPPAPAANEPKLYAGILKGEEGLIKGIEEIGKALSLPKNVVAYFNQLAKDKKFDVLETEYKAMAAEYEERKAANPPVVPPSQVSPSQTPAPGKTRDYDATLKSLNDEQRSVIKTQVEEDIAHHEVQKDIRKLQARFEKAGYELPMTKELSQKMEEAGDYFLVEEYNRVQKEYSNALKEITTSYLEDVAEYNELMGSKEPAMKVARENGMKALDSLGIGLTPEQKEAYIKEALDSKSPVVFEDINGELRARPNGIKDFFNVNHIEEVRLAAGREARLKYDAEQEELRKKSLNTIGTVGLPGSSDTSAAQGELNPNDDAQVDALSSVAEIEAHQRKLAARGR